MVGMNDERLPKRTETRCQKTKKRMKGREWKKSEGTGQRERETDRERERGQRRKR